jgi:hypothetical protein
MQPPPATTHSKASPVRCDTVHQMITCMIIKCAVQSHAATACTSNTAAEAPVACNEFVRTTGLAQRTMLPCCSPPLCCHHATAFLMVWLQDSLLDDEIEGPNCSLLLHSRLRWSNNTFAALNPAAATADKALDNAHLHPPHSCRRAAAL